MRFHIEGDVVEFSSGYRAHFHAPVLNALDLGKLLIVVLDPGPSRQSPENVYALNAEGLVVWRVQRFAFPHGRTPYTGAYEVSGELALYNQSGVEAFVDRSTGRVLRTELVR